MFLNSSPHSTFIGARVLSEMPEKQGKNQQYFSMDSPKSVDS
jgi:hypothetical protein